MKKLLAWTTDHLAVTFSALIVGLSLIVAGLASSCGELSKGTANHPSPYGGVTAAGELKTPDRVLYDTDFIIAAAYDALHSTVKLEYDLRQAGQVSPEFKAVADKIRAGAPGWFKSAVAVRDAYAASPTAENRTALQKSLDVLQQAIAEANRHRAFQPLPP